MNKECNNCYWKFEVKEEYCAYFNEQPKGECCDEMSPRCKICENNEAEYMHENKAYCSKCILEELEIEPIPHMMYFHDSEYIGDENDSLIDILEVVDSNIKEID